MRALNRAPTKGAKTKLVTVRLIGGEGDYGEENIGFERTDEGLRGLYTTSLVSPMTSVYESRSVLPLPGIGMTMFVRKSGGITLCGDVVRQLGCNVSGVTPVVYERPDENGNPDYYVIAKDKLFKVLYDRTYTTESLPYQVFCGVYRYGRLFIRRCDEPYIIRWSAPDAESWEEGASLGGKVELSHDGGEIKAMVNLGEKLIVFRELGVNVMTALADARAFTVRPLVSYGAPPPAADAIASAGGRIWYSDGKGLYCYGDGELNKRALPEWLRGYTVSHIGAVDPDFLLMSVYLNSTRYMVKYRIKDGACTLCLPKTELAWRDGKGINAVYMNCISRLKDSYNSENVWRSVPITLGTALPKTLKRLVIEGDELLKIRVSDGLNVRQYGRGVYDNPGLRGTAFTFTVASGLLVKDVTAQWEVSE